MALTKNKSILEWIDKQIALVNPDKVVWIDGSEEQTEARRAEACATGEIVKLNQELLPDCYYHRTHPTDVARVEDRTLIWEFSRDISAGLVHCLHLTLEQVSFMVFPLQMLFLNIWAYHLQFH